MPDLAKPLIVLHNPSFVLKRRDLQALLQQLLPESEAEYGLEQFWAGDDRLEAMVGAIPAASLLADNRVVVLHELQNLPLREQKPLAPALASIPPGTTVVITTAPKSDRDKKPPLAAEVLKVARSIGEVREYKPPYERELPGWVMQEARTTHGKHMSPPDAQLLVETCGTDLDRLANEIAKLAQYVGGSPAITAADIQVAAAPLDDRDVFALVDAIGRRDVPAAVGVLRALMPAGSKRGVGLSILGMITRQIRLLWQAVYVLNNKVSLGNMPDEVKALLPEDTALAGAHSYVRDKIMAQARNFTEAQLARALVRIYETDLMLKGASDEKADERTVLEMLVVSLCRK